MADLISAQTGNFTTAATWQTVQATGMLDSEAGTVVLSTTAAQSSTFVLPATAIDGVAIKLASVSASPSGTILVRLHNVTAASNTDVTINVADLPASGLGWVFFKFAASFTPNGTDTYALQCSTSVNNMVTLYRDGTTSNMCRRIRTTTTQAPAAGNHLVISNQFTGAGASTAVTVTMDNTATTSFGPTVSGGPPQGIVVSGKGTLTLGTASSTNYYLKWKGVFLVCGGGTVNLASSGSRLASSSTCTLFCDSAAGGDTGIQVDVGGTFLAYGAAKTNTIQYLTTDLPISTSTFTCSANAGWAIGDTVAIAPTDQTYTHSDKLVISGTSGTGTCTTSTTSTTSHSGTSPTQAEVVNLTRNIVLTGSSSTLTGYFFANTTSTVVLSYVENTLLGINSTNKYGITIGTTTGSFLAEFCSIHDCTVSGAAAFFLPGSGQNNFTIDHCVMYNISGSLAGAVMMNSSSFGTNWAITNNVIIFCVSNRGFYMQNMAGTMTGNTVAAAASYGYDLAFNTNGSSDFATFPFSSNTAHSNANHGVLFDATFSEWTFGRVCSWRNAQAGAGIGAGQNLICQDWTIFGNAAQQMLLQGANITWNVTFNNLFIAADSTFAVNYAIDIRSNLFDLVFNTCTFDSTTGIYRRQIQTFVNAGQGNKILFNNCLVNPSSQSGVLPQALFNTSYLTPSTFGYRNASVAFQSLNQVAGDNRYYTPLYYIVSDSTLYNTASPSERVIPGNASYKAWSSPHRCTIASSSSRVVTVAIRQSTSTDSGGVNYTGSAPRLIQRANPSIGVGSDTVLATLTLGLGTWGTMTGTTGAATDDGVAEFFVDCDGTSGAWINLDDWSAS